MRRNLTKVLAFLLAAVTFSFGSVIYANPNKQFFPDNVSDVFFRSIKMPTSKLPLGHILETRPGAANFSPGARVVQLAFVSSDSFNKKLRATATLILPPTFNEHSGILAYPAWNDSAGRQCSLGYFHGGPEFERLAASPFSNVSMGLTEIYGAAKLNDMGILIPDSNGPDMAFGANILSGHITLDAMRAVKNFKGFQGVDFSKRKFGVFGYSGGGMMAAWAAVLEPTYAKDLRNNIVNYVAGGTPVDFVDLAEKYNFFNDQPKEEFGIATALMIGLSREYPNFDIGDKLNELGVQKFIASRNSCLTDIIAEFKNYSGAKILKSTQKSLFKNIIDIAYQNSLFEYRGALPIKPIHFWHATVDTEIPQSKLVRELVARWRAKGVPVDYQGFSGDHKDLGFKIIPQTIDYFAGKLYS